MQALNQIYKSSVFAGIFSVSLMTAVAFYDQQVSGTAIIVPMIEVLLMSVFILGVHKKSFLSAALLFAYFLVFRVCFPISEQTFGVYLNAFLLYCFFRPLWLHWRQRDSDNKELYCAE